MNKKELKVYRSITAVFAIIAGILDIFNGLLLLPNGSVQNEWVYVFTDFAILMMLVGLLGLTLTKLGPIGLLGWFLCFFGFAFITGPSATVGNVEAYVIGTSVIGIGFLLLAVGFWRISWIPRSVPILLILTVMISVMGIEIEWLGQRIVLSNVLLGFALLELGLTLTLRAGTFSSTGSTFPTHLFLHRRFDP